MVKFQVLTWDSRDENNDHYIRLFGKTLEGKSVCVTTTFKPYFFIKIPVGSSQEALKGIIEKKFHEEVYEIEEVEAKDVWGFQNNEKRRFLQVRAVINSKKKTHHQDKLDFLSYHYHLKF